MKRVFLFLPLFLPSPAPNPPKAQFSELAEDKIGISVNLQCKSFGAGVPVTTSQELQPGPSRVGLGGLLSGEEEHSKSESSDDDDEPG